jgi:hypothetical protein
VLFSSDWIKLAKTEKFRATLARVLPDQENRRLLMWLAFWVVLPNFGFSMLWIVGSPPRYPDIVAIGTVGLILRKHHGTTQFCALLVMIIYTMMMFVCRLFGMRPGDLVQSAQYLGELNPVASPEYMLLLVTLILTLASAILVSRRPLNFASTRSLFIAVVAVGLMALLDFTISYSSRGTYQHDAPKGANFQSAATLSQFEKRADGRRHLLLVVVEAMGAPREPLIANRLFARFNDPAFLARYETVQGETRYFGTTTNAEVRELCGHWGNYFPLLDKPEPACLPARLAKLGYRTTAMHAFRPSFFQRESWYPNIGFQHLMFEDALVAQGAAACAGVFEGACDRDVPAIIVRLLKTAKSPQFVYWLTLNSHIPVPSDKTLHTANCAAFAPELAQKRPMACRMLMLWDESFGALAREMTKPDFPQTDVLIVGDHMPPFFSRKQRSAFDNNKVPWILLRAKPRAPEADLPENNLRAAP